MLAASIFLLLGIIASKASERLGIPVLLLFLLIGMLAGSDGLNIIYFDDPWLAQLLGVVALVFILFDGGLTTDWKSIRPVLKKGIALSTAGVLLTAVCLGLFAMYALGFSLLEGLLLGAIVSSTDAAAVFAVLRSKRISLKGELKPLLELESGSNDPMAVFLTVSLISLMTVPGSSVLGIVPVFFQQLIIGGLAGYGLAMLMLALINRLRLEYEGLYAVLTTAFILLTYGITAALGGSGFLAVYIAGLVVGNSRFIHKNSLTYYHNGLAWLMQIVMFLTLGLLVFPLRLIPLMLAGIAVSLFLMLVARPASVFLILALFPVGLREKLLISWVGLRGSVPIVLATFPLLAGLDTGHTIFNLVFFIVVASVLLQGTTISYVARFLRLEAPLVSGIECVRQSIPLSGRDSKMMELRIPKGAPAIGRSVLELDLPKGVLIVTLKRGNDIIVPGGGTVLEEGDSLLVLAGKGQVDKLCSILGIG